MPVISEPNSTNVSAGPAILYLAPSGTPFPSLAAKPAASDWATAGFKQVGYTESGVDITTTPSVKDITPDEVISPVKQIVTAMKAEIKTTLLEATLENMSKAVALSILANPGSGIKTMSVGSGNPLQEFALGIQTASVGGADDRVTCVWRVNSLAAVQENHTRKDATKVPVTFTALTDSTQPSTQDLYQTVDFNAGS